MREATSTTVAGSRFEQRVRIGPHTVTADEPPDKLGADAGPEPHELVFAALAACTSMTIKMYADRKQWPLESVEVRVEGDPRADAFVLRRHVRLVGALDEDQRRRCLEIANRCPVHKTLSGAIRIESDLTP